MSLDKYSFDIDSWTEWLWNNNEKVSNAISEKIKESIKKWNTWIWRTQKDEQKAKKYDFLLASFLVKIIIDKKYDSILENIFKTLNFWYSSNFLLWILSLIHLETSDKIREISNKEKIIFDFKLEEVWEFNEKEMRPQVRERVNLWIEDIIDSVSLEFSNIQNKRNLEILEKDKKVIIIFTAQVFSFFLKECNILIKKESAISLSEYIISEITKTLKNLEISEI